MHPNKIVTGGVDERIMTSKDDRLCVHNPMWGYKLVLVDGQNRGVFIFPKRIRELLKSAKDENGPVHQIGALHGRRRGVLYVV